MVNIAVTLYITVPHFHVLLYRGLDAVMAPKPAPAPGAAPASKKPRGKKPKSRSNSRNTTPQGSPEHKARRQEEPIEPITIPAPRTDAGKKKRGKKSNPNSPVLKSSSPPPKAVEEAEGVLSAKLTEQKTSSGGAKGPKLSAGAEAARIAGAAVAKAAVGDALANFQKPKKSNLKEAKEAKEAKETKTQSKRDQPQVTVETYGSVTAFSVKTTPASPSLPMGGRVPATAQTPMGVSETLGIPPGVGQESERPVLTQPVTPARNSKPKPASPPGNKQQQPEKKSAGSPTVSKDSAADAGPLDQLKRVVADHIGPGDETFYGVCAAGALIVAGLGWALMRRKK